MVQNGTGRRAWASIRGLEGEPPLSIGGKTGTGDNRRYQYAAGGAATGARPPRDAHCAGRGRDGVRGRNVTTLLSVADYAELAEHDERYVTELVRGVVVREPRRRHRHGQIQVEIAFQLRAWAGTRDASVTVESGYILSDDPATVRGPDVAVVLGSRSSDGQPGGWLRGAPDLAVEILSPSDTSIAVHQKTLQYLEAGARLVWIVDPDARTVTIYRPNGSANLVRAHEVLTGEDVLPGLSVDLSDVMQ